MEGSFLFLVGRINQSVGKCLRGIVHETPFLNIPAPKTKTAWAMAASG